MLQCEKLDALFQLLKEMTLCSRGNDVSGFSRWIQQIGKWLIIIFVSTMALFVIVALWYRSRSDQPVHRVPGLVNDIYLMGMLWAVLYVLTIIADVVVTVCRSYRQRFQGILVRLQGDLLGDTDFLARLQSFDKPTLEYGLIQYRHNYGIADGRIAMVAGDLRKIGLFPALATAAMAAATLLKDNVEASLLWAPLILTCCFYLVSIVTIGRRERVGQVVALVEYSISHAEDSPRSPLAAATHAARPQTSARYQLPLEACRDDDPSARIEIQDSACGKREP